MKMVIKGMTFFFLLHGLCSHLIGSEKGTSQKAAFSITDGATPVSMSCVSPKKKVSVTAYKKNSNDAGLVKVRITDGSAGDNDPGQMISESEFEKNTKGVRVKKLFFCFDPQGGKNRVLAAFKKKGNTDWGDTVQTFVNSRDTISKMVIDTEKNPITIELVVKKVTVSTITVPIKLPSGSGPWRIVSGNKNLTEAVAKEVKTPLSGKSTTEGVVQIVDPVLGKNPTIKIAKVKNNEDTVLIFAENSEAGANKVTVIQQVQVAAAGSKPVLVIDKDGGAQLMTSQAYAASSGKAKHVTVAPTTPALLQATQQPATGNTATTLPPDIDIKLLLNSLVPDHYERDVAKLMKADDRASKLVEAIRTQDILPSLVGTPLVKWKMQFLKKNSHPDDESAFKKKMSELQPLYTQIFPSLKSTSGNVDPSLQATLEDLRMQLKAALAPEVLSPITKQ